MKPYSINKVRLTHPTFRNRQEKVREYIVNFDLDRLMHNFRVNAGIASDASPLGGWEAPWCGLRGHFTGHFLSAAANFAYGAGDEECKNIADRIVDILAECADSDGYLSAFGRNQLDTLENNENHGIWAPYYTLHKIISGLVACGLYLGNEKAMSLAENLALYIYGRFEKLPEEKINRILLPNRLNPQNEFGGIGEALYSLYEIRKNEKVLSLAKIFDRDYFIGELSFGNDVLTDLHANTHLPQILSALKRYEVTGEEIYLTAAENFYEFLVPRTFANGNSSGRAEHFDPNGVSAKSEHWGIASLDESYITGGESESCCAHNTEIMLEKLVRFGKEEKRLRYLSHLESIKYNAVLNCASEETGLSQYHQLMGKDQHKHHSSLYDDFWCCTASGVEALSELQKNIWFNHADGVFLNMFVSSELYLNENVTLSLSTSYPKSPKAEITVKTSDKLPLSLSFKAGSTAEIFVNGNACEIITENGFSTVKGIFSDGDTISVSINSDICFIPLGESNVFAIRYGSILLAKIDGEYEKDEPLSLTEDGRFLGKNCTFIPLYEVGDETYTVYMNSGHTEHAEDGSSAYESVSKTN